MSDIPSARVGGAVHQRFEGSAPHLHGLERRHAQGAQSICFPLLGLALTICLCQVWEPGSFETAVVEVKDAHVRHTGARAIPPFCGAWCPRFVTLGAGLLAGAMGLFAGKDASLGISEVYQSDFNRQAISCGADGRVVLWKDL